MGVVASVTWDKFIKSIFCLVTTTEKDTGFF